MRKNENADGEIGFKISLFFALIAVALALPAVFADLSVTSYTLSPQTIKPGTSGLVTLTIANTGNTLVSGISLSATGSGKLFSNADIFVGDISPGGSTIISVPFSAQADAQPGIYNFQAKLTGSTPSSTSASATNAITQRTFTVPVTITNPAILQATAKSNLVYTDGTFTLEGTILNSGGAAGNARLYVGQATDPRLSLGSNSAQAPSSGFIAKQLPIYVGEIANRSSFSAEVTLASNISSGVYSMPIGVLYDDAVGNTIFDKMLVLVNVKRSSPDFAIQLENQNFSPGQRTNLKLKISNTGTRDASNLRIALGDSAALTPLGASVAKLDLLSHGQSAALQFEVGVNNALPGFYSIPFRISYQNDKGDEQPAVTQSAGMNIAVPAQVDFFVTSKPSPIVSGEPNTISIQVSNTGVSQLTSLKVGIVSQEMQVLDAQNEQFVGGLNPDDYNIVPFKVSVKQVNEGTYPLRVFASFKDSYNAPHSVEREIQVTVVSKETAARLAQNGKEGSPILLIGAIALIAALVWYFKFRKHHPKHPA